MTPRVTMREALADKALLGHVLAAASWQAWRVLLIAAAGEELTEDERVIFRKLTGREREPLQLCRELIVAAGRRAGKTEAVIIFAVWIAALCDHSSVLTVGELGVVLIVSQTQLWSREILTRIEGVFSLSAPLAPMIIRRTADAIDLLNGVRIEVRPASYRTLRGPTFICVIADEIAFWYTSVDYANPDTEILGAIRPGLLTTGGPLLMVSSTYAKTGVLYDSYRRYFGADGPPEILVAYGTSRDFNPSLPQAEIDRALARDPVANRAEFLSEWRNDVEGFISREIVEACVGDYFELPPQPGVSYACFVDAATGVDGGDHYAIAIAHAADKGVIIDVLREQKPPFAPAIVVSDILIPLCRAYGISKVVGDNFAGAFAANLIRNEGVAYELATKHKSQLYVEALLPMLTSGLLTLPRHEAAINQICGLERSALRSGRDQISHSPHSHDDAANAIAGAAFLAHDSTRFDTSFDWVTDPPSPPAAPSPELTASPQYNGDWWRWKKLPRQPDTRSADHALHQFYAGLDQAMRWRR